MDMVTLGRTGITVNKNGFGALPIQRVSREEAARLLRMALDAGITFFDTARFYTDSEEKIGYALSDRRDAFYLATKTAATTAEGFWSDLETSLRNLKTDYIDIYQFHNPAFCPKPGDGSGLYEAMLEARRQGKIRFISITNHRMTLAHEAIRSGLYDTLQFPFCYLATDKDIAVAEACREAGMGFIAMKGPPAGSSTTPPPPMPGWPNMSTCCPSGASSGSANCGSSSPISTTLPPSRRRSPPWWSGTGPNSRGISAGAAATACPAPQGSRSITVPGCPL